jgi:hypothetical protein
MLTGHSPSFINKNVVKRETAVTSYILRVGLVQYDAWKSENRIYCQVALSNHVRDSYWFQLDTLKQDYVKQDQWDEEIRKEIRERY